MTRRRDLMCEDIFGCDHSPETPLVQDNQIVAWVCRCGAETTPAENRTEEKKEDNKT